MFWYRKTILSRQSGKNNKEINVIYAYKVLKLIRWRNTAATKRFWRTSASDPRSRSGPTRGRTVSSSSSRASPSSTPLTTKPNGREKFWAKIVKFWVDKNDGTASTSSDSSTKTFKNPFSVQVFFFYFYFVGTVKQAKSLFLNLYLNLKSSSRLILFRF